MMTALIFFAFAFSASAQWKEFPNFKATPTEKGLMLVNQKGAPDYAILIPGGTEAEHDDVDGGLTVKIAGGGEIRVYYANAKFYAKTKNASPETVLKNYRALKVAQLEIDWGEKITIDEEFNGELPAFDLRRGKDEKTPVYASFWSFPLSGAKKERLIYLAVIIGDSILTLRKDLPGDKNAQEESAVFTTALKTLTVLPAQKLITPPQKQPVKPKRRKN